MNTNWKVIVGTLAIFLAGLVTGIVTQKIAHYHPDHFGVMHEFSGPGGRNGPSGPGGRCEGDHGWFHHGPSAGGEPGRPEFGGGPGGPGEFGHPPFVPSPEFEQQLRDYDAKLSVVLEPFKVKENAVFTPDQQKKLEELKAHHFGDPVPPGAPGNPGEQPGAPALAAPAPGAGPGPGLSEHHGEFHPPGLMRFIGIIIYKPVLAHLTEKLSLTAKQQTQLEAIFKDRREAVLKFVDDNPPPTIKEALATPPPVPPAPAPTPSK